MARRARIQEQSTEEEGNQDQDDATAIGGQQEAAADAPSADSVSGGFNVIDRSNDDPLATIEVIEATPKRGRPPGTTRPRVPKATPSEIAQAAPMLVGLANQAVVTWAGPECAMLQAEANYLTPSVARVLSRLPRGAAQAVSVYTDPFIIIIALGLWGSRIMRIKESQAKQKYQVEPFEAARAYGESGTELTTTPTPPTEAPIASEPRSNGTSDAILRTVSRT